MRNHQVYGIVLCVAACVSGGASAGEYEQLPNNKPFVNASGNGASWSTQGFIDFTNPFHVPLGSNGRSCLSCHLPEAGWSIRPIDVERKFEESAGTDPIFHRFDANTPTPDESSLEAKYASYSMLRQGLFRRGGALPATAEFEIIAVDDPLGAGGSLTRFEFFRRPLATANFHIAKNVGWHDQSTNGSGNVHAGLVSQAANNVVTGQEGPPAPTETIEAIVAFEEALSYAQQFVVGAGRLDACGGRGGPELLAAQAPVNGPFDLFDAWAEGAATGPCAQGAPAARRAQIARGQEIFNTANANGRSCRGCHNAANNGSNVNGTLFDVGASRPEFRLPGMPLYTLRHKTTLAERQTTDPGRAARSGRWADLDRFKVPSLRGLAARPPYFHNGIAATLRDVVLHYEAAMGFQYTEEERAALVAFMESL
jgi:cytochrome c peroxidase